jgi:rSAM-associated Gly-rich repeat protein
MDEQPDRYQSVKSTLLELVRAGVGSAVLASSLLSTSGTDPAPGDGADPARIEERVRGVRDDYGVQPRSPGDARGPDGTLAWLNGGWHNTWLNGGWPNGAWRNLWLNGGWPNVGWRNLWQNLW